MNKGVKNQCLNLDIDRLFDRRIKWITVKDTARYLGITENSVRILICRGVLKHYKLGGKTLLRISEIDEQIVTSKLKKGG